MVFIPMIKCPDGEIQNTFYHGPPITWKMEREYYRGINSRYPLMDYVADKYWHGSLKMMCRFDKKIRADYQVEIGKILKGYSTGEIW
jgi:hypothetical protein